MITRSGKAVFPDSSRHYTGDVPTIYDVGYGIARQIRFAGQTVIPYSVLCHTMVVTTICDPSVRVHALLHDAAEAIIGDTPATWKHEYTTDDEEQILWMIYESIGLDMPVLEERQLVREADLHALAAEAHALGHAAAEKYWPMSGFTEQTHQAFAVTSRLIQNDATITFIKDADLAARGFEDDFNRLIADAADARPARVH